MRDASTAASPPHESGRTQERHRVRLAQVHPSICFAKPRVSPAERDCGYGAWQRAHGRPAQAAMRLVRRPRGPPYITTRGREVNPRRRPNGRASRVARHGMEYAHAISDVWCVGTTLWFNGAAQESNLPSVGLRRRTGFEDALSRNPEGTPWCTRLVLRRLAAFTGALVTILVLATPALAAAPNYILVSGPGIKRPILMASWGENGAFLSALVGAPKAKSNAVTDLARRPRFDLAMFWGWGDRPRPTRPGQANQHGWFYPAHGSQPPVIVVMANGYRFPRLVPRRALKVLARHHVPLRA